MSRTVLHVLRHVVDDQRVRELPDQELLRRFTSAHDEAAFHVLLRRHGPMVLNVCRALLSSEADVEDAFQATFLILTNRAGSIRKTASLSSWLHGVAYRTARKAQAQFARRQKHEQRASQRESTPPDDLTWREVQQVIHEELAGLSERYRAPLTLCYLQGRTQDETAAQLGLAKGTLKARLERGRGLLRARLVRRGLGPAALLLATAWPARAMAAVPVALLNSTIQAVLSVTAPGAAAGLISARVAALTKEVLRAMFISKVKTTTAVLALLVALGLGLGGLAHQTWAQKSDPREEPRVELPIAAEEGKQGERIQTPASKEATPEPQLLAENKSDAPVNALAVSPDGKVLASGDGKGTVLFLDMATGKIIRLIKAHTARVTSVKFSPDGKKLATASEDRTIKLWDVATGREIATLQGKAGVMALSVDFSPDGKTLASGNKPNRTIQLWEVETSKNIATLTSRNYWVGSVAFSPDGKTLASGGDNASVQLWDVAGGKEIAWLKGHASMVHSVAFSPDGKMLASGGDRTVRLWDPASAKEIAVLQGHTGPVNSVAFSPDGKAIASGSVKRYEPPPAGESGEVRVWDVATGKLRSLISEPKRGVNAVTFSPDGKILAVGMADGTIKLWDVGGAPEK